MKHTTVTRREFVSQFMRQAGLTHEQAGRVYRCFVSMIEDGIVNGAKVGVGRVGVICPILRPPRKIRMGFKRGPGGDVRKCNRVFYLGTRTSWEFRLYREFKQRHGLAPQVDSHVT